MTDRVREGWLRPARYHAMRAALLGVGLVALRPAAAWADQPTPWQMWSQPAATPTMARIDDLHVYLTWIMVGICVLVIGLLAFVMWRFHHSRNPVPSTRAHNTPLEIVWTLIPIAILVAVAVPSFNLLYYMDRTAEADMTVKVVGHQWYWSYEYPDHGGFGFASFMKYPEELEPGEPNLLAVDQPLVLPVGATVRVLLTASDVIHSWAVPALGVKTDTVPGRISETWVRIERPGVYYGQCSELCGVNHGFMPIEVRAVPPEAFETWLVAAQAEFAAAPPGAAPPVALATR